MANDRVVAIRITADGRVAIEELDKVDRKLGDQPSKLDNLKENWLEFAAAVGAAMYAANKAWDLAEQSAKFEQSRQAFGNMVRSMGRDAQVEFAKINAAAGGLIDQATLTEAANRALSLGIPIDKLGNLMEIARAKARDMGITTTQAFGDIVTGIGRGSPMIIDNLGITLRIGEANEKYATSIGKTVEQLTDAEKKTALLNAVLVSGESALKNHNLQVDTAYEKMQRWKTEVKDAMLIVGDIISRLASGVYGIVFGIGAAVNGMIAVVARAIQKFGELVDKIPGMQGKFAESTEFFKGVADNSFAAMKSGWDSATTGFEHSFRAFSDGLQAQNVVLQDAKNEENRILEESAAKAGAIAQKVADDEITILQRRLSATQSITGDMAQAFQLMYAKGGQSARAWFSLYKIAAISEATIAGISAAIANFQKGSQIGGLPLGIAWAAASTLLTGAKIAAIRAQQFGSSAAPGGAGGGGYPTNPATGLPESSAPPTQVTININGQQAGMYELAGGVLKELDRNNGSIDGYSVTVERSA